AAALGPALGRASDTTTAAVAAALAPGGGPALYGGVDPQWPAAELVAVEAFDRCLRSFGVGKLDERESARPPGRAIGGEEDLRDGPGLREQLHEVVLGGRKLEVADE